MKKKTKRPTHAEIQDARLIRIEERLASLEKKGTGGDFEIIKQLYKHNWIEDEYCPCCGKKRIEGPFLSNRHWDIRKL